MIDFHVSWSIVVVVSTKCQFSYLTLWGVSFIVDLNFCSFLLSPRLPNLHLFLLPTRDTIV